MSAEGGHPAADDTRHMLTALTLAKRTLGQVWPNPAVGCIIVKHEEVVGRGWTGRGGRPHAESQALSMAGSSAMGATVYVSLEPCCHVGVTPPCVDGIIAAGVARVVVAVADPDPRVSGGGIDSLSRAGIDVSVGIRADEAAELNRGFFIRCEEQRPLFTLKMATSLDGRIATRAGESKWITGGLARRVTHRLRSSHDAVLVGSETALADDPELDCRLPGMEGRSPVRIVVDGRLRLTLESRLVRTAARTPTWIVTRADADREKMQALSQKGVTLLRIEPKDGDSLKPLDIAHALAEKGLTRILIEGGGRIAASFLTADLVDRMAWFHGPLILGGDAIPATAAMEQDFLARAPRFHRTEVTGLGDDVLELLQRVG